MPLPLIHYLYPSKLSKFLHKGADGSDSWALVTGASDGIGRALSSELAGQGFNVVLHGRNSTKLNQVSSELSAQYPSRHFRTVTIDASSFSPSDIDALVAQIADIRLTVLINNVGGTAPLSSNFKRFEDTTPTEMQALFSLNVLFPMQLTRALLPKLQSQQPGKPTLVVTCSSLSYIGQAYIAAYSGCKAALHAWNRGLAAEQREAHSGVEIIEVVIGGTYTQQLQKDENFKPGLFMPEAGEMAKSVLRRVGQGHFSVIPYFWHNVQYRLLYGIVPAKVADGILVKILKPSVEAKAD